MINFLKFYKVFFLISCAISVVLLGVILTKGFQYGTDFTGGIEVTISFEKDTSKDFIQTELEKQGFNPDIEKIISRANSFRIRNLLFDNDATISENKLTEALESSFQNYSVEQIHIVGGVLSSQNKSSAFSISLVVVLLIIGYITLRFNLSFSISAIIAVIHDILIMLGVVSIFELEMEVLIIVAVLTIFGYSVNDSIVLFDRIRERKNHLVGKIDTFKELLNLSISSVISRTIITSITTLIVVLALWVSTEGSYREFATVLIVGIFSGTYSSIYIAGSVLLIWDKKKSQLS